MTVVLTLLSSISGLVPDAAGDALLIDSHDAPVAPEVWALYRRFMDRAGPKPTLIERDGNVPDFDVLMAERAQAVGALSAQEVSA